MKIVAKWMSGTLVSACVLSAPALAGNEKLDRVRELIDSKSYVDAKAALARIDRGGLSADEARTYDEYNNQVAACIAATERAERDFHDAEWAYANGRWAEACRLYQIVLDNACSRQSIRNT